MVHLSANVHAYRTAMVAGSAPAEAQELIDFKEDQRADVSE